MRVLVAMLAGSFSGAIAVLLHQTLPPLGIVAGLIASAITIWAVGRHTGERRYKFLAAVAWLATVVRAGTFGVAQELLVQGDGVGTALLFVGTPLVVAVAFKRV